MVGIGFLAQVGWPRLVGICWLAMVGWPRLVGIGLLAWLVGPGWLAQVRWHRIVGHGLLAQLGWPRFVGWLAGLVGSKYFPKFCPSIMFGSPRIFEPIFFVGILGEPDQRYPLLTHVTSCFYSNCNTARPASSNSTQKKS